MMNENGGNSKLDWMYKGANSLVDREEYLLGKSVDKSLEQLNAEEKEKRLGIVPPKNHVEHECIPPSIRDFNKIVQAEQVDISAKLQEDPLVAIKKREEEARRQFLQNPVQLKKLQEALKAQEVKKKKSKHKKSKDNSDSDLDTKIANKLKYLKGDASNVSDFKKKKKKSKDDALDTILMHKFNELKDQLSQEDLNDILAGKVSDSDEKQEENKYKRKNSSNEDSDHKQKKLKKKERKHKSSRSEMHLKDVSKKRRYTSSSSDSSEDEKHNKKNYKKKVSRESYRDKNDNRKKFSHEMYRNGRKKQVQSSSEYSSEEESERKYKKKSSKSIKSRGERTRENNLKYKEEADRDRKKVIPDDDLESKILEKLRILRESSKSKRSESSSDSESKNRTNASPESDEIDSRNRKNDSDSDEGVPQSRAFGLVKADGTKIALNKRTQEVNKTDKFHKVETVTKPERKNVKKLTEEEKEQMRREMMKNAEKRDKERSENLNRYREEDKREEKSAANFDKDFMHKQLLRTTKEATVESRIKSNLNNIQRSSRHMDTHFSRR